MLDAFYHGQAVTLLGFYSSCRLLDDRQRHETTDVTLTAAAAHFGDWLPYWKKPCDKMPSLVDLNLCYKQKIPVHRSKIDNRR
jgi:hypothetical protein